MAKVAAVEKPLRDKLGEEGSQSLINLINVSKDEQKQDMLTFVEEKFEHRLTTEIGKINARITEEIGKVNERITKETGNLKLAIAQTEQRLDNRITTEISKVNERMTEELSKVNERITAENSKTRADLIKWMFIFWIGQIGAIMGLLFAFFK